MTKTYLRGGVALAAMTLALELTAPTEAAAQTPAPTPPVTRALDGRGVDLATGAVLVQRTDVIIGQPGQGGLSFSRSYGGIEWIHNFIGSINKNTAGTSYTVSIGEYSDAFTYGSGVFTSVTGRGATLSFNSSTQIYTYTAADGTKASFAASLSGGGPGYEANVARVTSLVRPNGEELTFSYKSATVGGVTKRRLQGVSNNFGYVIKLTYQVNLPTTASQLGQFQTVTNVTGLNLANNYCDISADSCTLSGNWPSMTYTYGGAGTSSVFAFTAAIDNTGAETQYTYSSLKLLTETLPDNSVLTMTYEGSSPSARVQSWSNGVNTWDYTYSDSGGYRDTTVTDDAGNSEITRSALTSNVVTRFTDANGNATQYGYDMQLRVNRVTQPEGNSVEYVYDARGNVTSSIAHSKISTDPDIITKATYPTDASCATDRIRCNLPLTITAPYYDGGPPGAVTNYEWDAVHGGIRRVTLPAAPNGIRPEVRTSYNHFYARYLNASGVVVNGPADIYLPVTVSRCQTQSSCDGTSDEVETRITYTPSVSTDPTNLLPRLVNERDGTLTLQAVLTYAYDRNGDVAQVDGPVTGMSSRFRYDARRRRIGMIGPDPDGSGPLAYRAMRYSYNNRGQLTASEAGTVAGYSDSNWANFSALQAVVTQYDTYGRPVSTRLRVGTTTYSTLQTRYDAVGRIECSITRMTNLNSILPSCSPQSGSAGYDRVTRLTYDAAGRKLTTVQGYGTTDASTETYTWTDNGALLTVKDGANHRSTFEYDGFDRLRRLRYPNATGGDSSTTDDEIYSYDARSNITEWTNRAGSLFILAYDGIGRLTTINAPTGTADITYSYDNLDRMLSATGGGRTVTRTYDALSRLLTDAGPQGQFSYKYDLAGNRIRISWPDGFQVNYTYNAYGQVVDIIRGTTDTLATYSYDNIGRRSSILRDARPNTTFTYTGPNLTGVFQDLTGSSHDVSLGLTYNPAGQIVEREVSNDNYVWDGAVAGAVNYTNNGRNQVTSIASVPVEYDGRGDIDAIGSTTFAYDDFSRMTVSGGVAINYDPTGRMNATGSTTYGYIGGQIAAVYSGSNLTERYVPGTDVDETVAYYDAAGNQRMLFGDERGSVIGYTNQNGYAAAFNSYDEYGVPGTSNGYGMQYTGQYKMPTIDGYYYKTRIYMPDVGRFMQPDSIRYGAGPNLYNYVNADPINNVDPTGTDYVEIPMQFCSTSYTVSNPSDRTTTCREDGTDLVWVPNLSDGRSGGGLVQTGGYYDAGAILRAKLQQVPQRCSARETPGRGGGTPFQIDPAQMATTLATKFYQHMDKTTARGGLQSYWNENMSYTQVSSMMMYLVATRATTPERYGRVRITGDVGINVGYDRFSNFQDTSYVTAIFSPPFIRPGESVPTRYLVTVYPSCPVN